VKVRRHASITVKFQDSDGKSVEWGRLGRAESELFQHGSNHFSTASSPLSEPSIAIRIKARHDTG